MDNNIENKVENNTETINQNVEPTTKPKKGSKVVILIILLGVLCLVAAFFVPSLLDKKESTKESDTKEESKEESKKEDNTPVEKPADLTKNSETVKQLFNKYSIYNYGASFAAAVDSNLYYCGDSDDDLVILCANSDDDLKLMYAIENSYESDLKSCEELETLDEDNKPQGSSSCYKADPNTRCGYQAECAVALDTKTKYAKVDKVKATYKEMFNEELVFDEEPEIDMYVGINNLYSSKLKVFYKTNLHILEKEKKLCLEELADIKVEGNKLIIISNKYYLNEKTNTCNNDTSMFSQYHYIFNYDETLNKYILETIG